MVGSIYFIRMPYSDFREFKGRPVLVFKVLDKADRIGLAFNTNLQRDGIVITKEGSYKRFD